MPLKNVPLPESKVPLKVPFVVLSMVGGCCAVLLSLGRGVFVSRWYLSFYRSFCGVVRQVFACFWFVGITIRAYQDECRFSRNRDRSTRYVVMVVVATED